MSDSIVTREARKINVKLEDSLLVICMALLACITMANVIVRYFTSQSFAWTEEISIFLMLLVTLLGSSAAFVRYQHIRIEFFLNSRAHKTRWYLDVLANAIVLLFFVIFTVLAYKMCLDEIEFGDTSPSIGVPTWWYSIWLPIISTLISYRVGSLLWRLFKVEHA